MTFRRLEPFHDMQNSISHAADSPQARLAASRKALIRQMARADGRPEQDSTGDSQESADDVAAARPSGGRSSTWQIFTQTAMAWWRHHPMQVALDISRPFLENYARDKPVQLLGIAAGVGAAVVLVKPWRLVSLTGLAVAVFKSTSLSNTLLSLLPRAASKPLARSTPQPPKDLP